MDPLIRDIESYLAGDWDSWDVEAAGLLEQCLERLTQRNENPPVVPTTPVGDTLKLGAAVRVATRSSMLNGHTGTIVRHDPINMYSWCVSFPNGYGYFAPWELEIAS